MPKNCYVHIPFCSSKCNYCSFVSFPCLEKMTGYVFSLLKEISENYNCEPLETLYIGGGTPSLLSVDLLSKLIKKFNFAQGAEITIEVNPEDVSREKIESYLKIGINRISMGVQSLDDNILKICGRRHSAQKALEAIDVISTTGCRNLSVDLIYGLPEQTLEGFLNDTKRLMGCPITHISLYGLKIEDNSAFALKTPKNLPDDDAQADMYIEVCDLLQKNGFLQYEISNFAKDGYSSKHNLNYWNNNEYYGFGVAAHGYVDGFRYYNTSSIDDYMAKPHVAEYAHHVTVQEALEEEIFLGMRRSSGINILDVNSKYGIDFEKKYESVLKKFDEEFIKRENNRISFASKGFMLSNVILSEFIGEL